MQLIGKYSLKKKVNRLSIPIRGVDFFFFVVVVSVFLFISHLFRPPDGSAAGVPARCLGGPRWAADSGGICCLAAGRGDQLLSAVISAQKQV